MRLYPKWFVSHFNAMRLSDDVWMIGPNGMKQGFHVVDLAGARAILNADYVFRNLLCLIPLALLLDLFFDLIAYGPKEGLVVLAVWMCARKCYGLMLDRIRIRHARRYLSPEEQELMWERTQHLSSRSVARVQYFMAAMAFFAIVMTLIGSGSEFEVFMLLVILLPVETLGPLERQPKGGSGREGLEALWAPRAPEEG